MKIFSNLAISLDGKIATSKKSHFPIGSDFDRETMQKIRKKSDAIINGASSIRAFKKPLYCKIQKKQPMNLLVSHELKGISPNWDYFKEDKIKRILFITGKVSKKRLLAFEKSSEIIHLKPRASIGPAIVRELKKRGIKNLLVEGGGTFMWEFCAKNLIDEYYVTLVPKIIGGKDAPTLVDGKGFLANNVLNLKLKKMRRVGDEVYFVYGKK